MRIGLKELIFRTHSYKTRKVRRLAAWIQERGLDVPRSSRLNGPLELVGPVSGLRIGENVHIGERLFVDTHGGVEICDHAHLSRDVVLLSSQHRIEGSRLPYDEVRDLDGIRIGEAVWIGMRAMILPGVTVGTAAVIGGQAVITRDVEPGAIVVGNNRVIGSRNRQATAGLLARHAFAGRNGGPWVP